MNRSLAIFVLLAVTGSLAASAAEPLPLKPQTGVLLLTNGSVIQGTITAAGDRYDVFLEDSEIHVKRSEVALSCRDLHECYLHKRKGIEQGHAVEHLDLAEWCLRQSLLTEAGQEIAAARKADGAHPKLSLLEARLKLAREAPPRTEPAKAPEKQAPAEQLDVLARGLPAGTMEHFTNSVQPVLLNYCSRAGCHSAAANNSFRLERISRNRVSGRHPTQRNLQSVLGLIDRAAPEESRLLAAPIRAHGTLKAPVFTDREQAQYRQIVQWVYMVAGSKAPGPAPTLEERTAPLSQVLPGAGGSLPSTEVPKGPSEDEIMPAEKEASNSKDKKDVAPKADGAPPANFQSKAMKTTPALRSAAKPSTQEFAPKDAFDPEIFNRRFFSR